MGLRAILSGIAGFPTRRVREAFERRVANLSTHGEESERIIGQLRASCEALQVR